MSKVAISGNASGTGTFTIAAPNSNTDRTLTLPDEAGTVLTSASTVVYPKGGPAFSARITTSQTISVNVNTKIVFGTEYFDTNSAYDATTGRFQPSVAGYYIINAQLYFPSNSSSYSTVELTKTGSTIAVSATATQTYVAACPSVSSVIYLNGSTDYVEVYGASGQSGTISLGASSRFSGVLVRAD